MNKTSKIFCLALAIVFALSTCLLAACNGTPQQPSDHQHTFSDGWTWNETDHWHPATCEHTDQTSGKAAHVYGDDGKCTVCGYDGTTLPPQQEPSDHQHTYTQSWWSDQTNHWHAALCEHTTEKSDVAAHQFNDYGRCTVCGYQDDAKINYNTSVTAAQWDKAIESFAKSTNFTAVFLNKSANRPVGTEVVQVDGYLLSGRAEDERTVQEFYENADISDPISIGGVQLSGAYSFEYEPQIYDEALDKLGEFAEEMADVIASFADLKWDAKSQSYVNEDSGLSFKFVGDQIYTAELNAMSGEGDAQEGELYRFTNFNNTVVEIPFFHTHELSTYYATSSMYHWNVVRCQAHQDEIVEKVPHTFGTDGKCSVCGYTKETTASRQVSEEQWQEALLLKGINNYTITYQTDMGFSDVKITAKGVYGSTEPDSEPDSMEYDDDGHMYISSSIGGKTYKVLADKMEYYEIKYYYIPYIKLTTLYYIVFVDQYEKFQFDSAAGKYVATDLEVVIDGDLLCFNKVEITFNGTEIEKMYVDPDSGWDTETYNTTFGNTVIEFDDLPEHTHNYEVILAREFYHRMACTLCGSEVEMAHTLGADDICTVCEVNCSSNHTHKYTVPTKVEHTAGEENWMYGHYLNCECGCWNHTREDHTFENGVCIKCGEKEHDHHTFDYENYVYVDGLNHKLVCLDPDCGAEWYFDHTYEKDENKCDGCGAARCWHECDNWNISEYGRHSGMCKKCNTYISESHDFDSNNTCKICGVMDHEHTWTNYQKGRKYSNQHKMTCSACTFSSTESCTFENGVCIYCKAPEHKHVVSKWHQGDYGHSGYCSVCLNDVSGQHTYDKNYDCTVCGYHHEHYCYYEQLGNGRHIARCYDCDYETEEPCEYDENNTCTKCGYYNYVEM